MICKRIINMKVWCEIVWKGHICLISIFNQLPNLMRNQEEGLTKLSGDKSRFSKARGKRCICCLDVHVIV